MRDAALTALDLSWEDVAESSRILAEKVAAGPVVHDVILAITRGGLIPAGMMSHILGIRDVASVALERYHGRTPSRIRVLRAPDWRVFRGKSVLIVDEIVEEGVTMEYVRRSLSEADVPLSTAVLYHKGKSANPDYFAHCVPPALWVAFPWETLSRAAAEPTGRLP